MATSLAVLLLSIVQFDTVITGERIRAPSGTTRSFDKLHQSRRKLEANFIAIVTKGGLEAWCSLRYGGVTIALACRLLAK